MADIFDIEKVLTEAINRITARSYEELPVDLPLSEVGLDSLGLSQIVFSVEEQTGLDLNDEVLNSMMEAETVGEVGDLLSNLAKSQNL